MSKLRIGWIGCGTHANEMLLPQITRFDIAKRGDRGVEAGALRQQHLVGVRAAADTADPALAHLRLQAKSRAARR